MEQEKFSFTEKKMIDNLIEIRKRKKISQTELAELTGNSQQLISRFEKNVHSPSMKLFLSIVDALGYELQLVKKSSL